jgi:hypothetical protein
VTRPRSLDGVPLARLWLAAIAIGCAVRLLLTWGRPLWHDEIFTLTLARQGALATLAALMEDTGPPLHYLFARLLLLPVGAPGPADVVVRLLSVAASLLHLPLLLRIARRTGDSTPGWRAAALFALCPAAVAYGAEGRAYPLASLLALAALERSLALRDGASLRATLGAALCSAGAVLTHYLALFPLAGLVWLLVRAEGSARRRLVGAWALGALVALPWAPVALRQPAAGLAWVQSMPIGGRVTRLVSGLVLGFDVSFVAVAAAAAAGLVLAGVLAARSPGGRTLVGVLACGLAALGVAGLLRPDVLIPLRTIVCFLPLVALVVARTGDAGALGLAAVFLAGLALETPAALVPTPAQQLAAHVTAEVRAGASVCVAGIAALELDYRLQRAGLPGRVRYFPSELARHPGWYDGGSPTMPVLRAEVAALRADARAPELYVLPHGAPASAALREWLVPAGAESAGGSPLLEVLRRPRP